ncbi:thioredoxin family protein [candidate division LCP-89 bacterium B3_LCP]|uniref:Thioredoxin family protein n=1 Tax=candidate division LCP-89 bacterium B3_LCP TaxID=2012998 RepID=A0A532V4M8_UNCL8|nr:MAG: thioredoxin family protein [candidate division LCP-89 bacterium B3_LCP]
MRKIEVLGPGCARCKKTERVVKQTLDELGWQEGQEYSLEKIENPNDIAGRGILMTPGVIIDGQIFCVGKVPTQKEISEFLTK